MKINQLLIILALSSSVMINSYNYAYDGDDAEVSYQTSWGKERFVKEDYIRYFPYFKKWKEQDYNFVNLSSINIGTLPFPYSAVGYIRPFNPAGMYFNGEYIKKLFSFNNIRSVIEIGSYYGVSTRHIASLLPENTIFYAIDSWEEFGGQYEQFLSNMIISGMYSKVIPLRMASDTAIEIFKEDDEKFDFIFIDGDHSTEAVLSDLENYYPLLSKTGVVCGDDWLLKTVRAAVVSFAEKYNLTVYADCNFWFLKKEDCGYCYKSFLNADDSAWVFGGK